MMTRLRNSTIAVAILAMALFAPRAAMAGEAPVLRAHVTVDGGLVTLGDLFENAGKAAATAVFRAPDPGEVGRVSASRIGEAARRHGLDWNDDARLEAVSVARTSTEIPLKSIRAEIAAAARARLGLGDDTRLSVELDPRARPLHLSSDASTNVIVARLDLNRETGAFAAEIRAERQGAGGAHEIYRGRAVETVALPVLAAPVARGEEIHASDITVRNVPRRNVTPGTLFHRDEVVGMAARRSLNPGDALREADIEAPKLVVKNSSVKLVYRSASLTITTLGRALDDGAKGEPVRILNLRSKRIVDGTVAARGTAIVETMTAAKTALLNAAAN